MLPENEIPETPLVPEATITELPLEVLLTRRPRKVYAGMWGATEIAAVSAASFILLVAILVYVFAVVPSNREVAKNRLEADRLEAELISAKSKYGEITSTEEQVGKLIRSAEDFESRFLPASANGQSALYQRLNGLIIAYGLTNTSGPDYAPLEVADRPDGNQTDTERGREKYRSLFPGMYVTVTLEGSYQNLRKFIREIETGNEFVVISSIELEPSDTEQKKPVNIGAPPPQTASNPAAGNPATTLNEFQNGAGVNPGMTQPQNAPSNPKGKTHGETVALRLEMAAYFRRPEYSQVTPPAGSQ